MIRNGNFLPGINKRSQVYALQRFDERVISGKSKFCRKEPVLDFSKGYEYSTGEWV